MQESWARLHGWRRRGRMAGGGSGGSLGSLRKGGGRGGGDLMRNSWPRMEGSGWVFFRGDWGRGQGVQVPLCNSAVLKARAVLEAWGCWGGGGVRVL